MKQKKKLTNRLVAAIVLIISSMAFLYADDYDDRTHQHRDSYFGFSHGTSEITGEEAPFVGISLGSEVSERTTVGAFAMVQALSDFPSSDLDLQITSTPSSFNFIVGAEMDVRLFRDSWINPMAHLEVGHMSVAHMSEPNNGDDAEPVFMGNSFYASVGTGFEITLCGSLSIIGLHGYRYVPNEAIEDIGAQKLSGVYNSVAVKVFVD
jgi:hypothetical protein